MSRGAKLAPKPVAYKKGGGRPPRQLQQEAAKVVAAATPVKTSKDLHDYSSDEDIPLSLRRDNMLLKNQHGADLLVLMSILSKETLVTCVIVKSVLTFREDQW